MSRNLTQIVLPSFFISIFLLIAILPIKSYDFYILLRWIVGFASIYFAYVSHELKLKGWVWIFAFVCIIFNPIIPVHLKKETWKILNVSAATIFMFYCLRRLKLKKTEKAWAIAKKNKAKIKGKELDIRIYTCSNCKHEVKFEIKKTIELKWYLIFPYFSWRYLTVCPICKICRELDKLY